jgi:hypothetical protein
MTNPQQLLVDLEWQIAAGADEVIGESAGLDKWVVTKKEVQSSEKIPEKISASISVLKPDHTSPPYAPSP